MLLKELMAGLEILWATGDLAVPISGVTADSRKAGPGTLFVAISGTCTDGHRYVENALARGATGVVISDPAACSGAGPRILVRDTRQALASLALRLAGAPQRSLNFVGITGTNGKSTTAHLLAQLLERTGSRPVGLLGTLGGRVGAKPLPHALTTPDPVTLARLLQEIVREGAREVVMEVSSHAISQGRTLGLEFSTAILTNISGSEHLDFHGTFENYVATKKHLFSRFLRGTAIINADDPFGREFAVASPRSVTYALKSTADLEARHVVCDLTQSRFSFFLQGSKVRHGVTLPFPGPVNIANTLAAIASALEMGRPLDPLLEAVEDLKPVRGRLEPVHAGQPFAILIDYAHTPDALDKLLQFVQRHCHGRVLVVFGCGGDRDRGKRPLMGSIAARRAHQTILTSDNPRWEDPVTILSEIAAGMGGAPCHREIDRRLAIRHALASARPKDAVIIAGKGHETTQEIAGQLHPFDDRRAVLDWLGQKGYNQTP